MEASRAEQGRDDEVRDDGDGEQLAPLSVLVAYLAAKIRAETEQADISAVMGDVEELLNDSIATEGYHIGPASRPESLINLSEIDFEALQAKFAQRAEKLRRLIEGKLAQMLKVNGSRVDLAEKFQKLIDEYNAGSYNIDALFAELVKFARELTEEEKRGVAEGLTEEELALFDILTKPEPTLTKVEEADVKKVCRELLATLPGLARKTAGPRGRNADAQAGDTAAADAVHRGHPGRKTGAGLRARLRPLLRRRAEHLPARRDQLAAPGICGRPSVCAYRKVCRSSTLRV